MGRRVATAALVVLALAPSAWLAWRWRAMPQFGLHQDDALYLVGAKSLAEGHGYRIESLPGSPFQTKYPPAVSAIMTLVWKFGPGFPANLKPATLLAWLMLPPCLLAVWALFRGFGFARREVWLLTFAVAWNPIVGVLSTSVMSDLLFLTLFVACLSLAERALQSGTRARVALAAGLIGGLAYLTRTAALPVLITAPLCFMYRRQLRKGALFLAGMLPAVGAWQAWTLTHMLETRDPALLFYTSYMAVQKATVRLDDLAQVLWHNSDELLRSLGKLLTFDVALAENVHLERILGVAAIVGAVRLVKRTRRLQYPAAAAGMAALLLVYSFTADERLSLPLYPLVLMGFWTEVKNFWAVLRKSWDRTRPVQRILAAEGAVGLGGVVVFLAASYAIGYAVFLPKIYGACERDLAKHREGYEWIRTRTAGGETVNAYDDPVLYLYTGRRALGMPMPSSRVYTGNAERTADRFIQDVPRAAREHGLTYLFVTKVDFYREGRAGALWNAVRGDPSLRKEYESAAYAVYRCSR
jgi:hypothetical protein